ncbi:MAG TPA: hypothetical protein VID95_04475 [Candidatus Limnocylindrales bacterium]|jgi:hypothetical protein
MTKRPLGATILAVLAGAALLLAIVHLLQALGIVPYFIGPVAFRDFSLWYVLLWGLMIWVWLWVIEALWTVRPEAWLFLLIVSGFNLLFDFITMAFSSTTTTDLTASFILSGIIFGYALLPSTKRGFNVE